MVKYLRSQDTHINALERGFNADSDCEGDPAEASNGALEGEEEETRAVLTAGSFSAYVHLLARWLHREMMTRSSPAGNLFSFIAAQSQSRSLPSNRKVLTIAGITFAKGP